MSKITQEREKKKDFVRANIKLFEEARKEMHNHKPRKPYGSKVVEFVKKARKKFGYADSTVLIDVWSKFQFLEINLGIDDRKAKNDPKVRKILGYGVRS